MLHTGSLHAMAVWGTPLGVCTQGGYAWSPTAVCSCSLCAQWAHSGRTVRPVRAVNMGNQVWGTRHTPPGC